MSEGWPTRQKRIRMAATFFVAVAVFVATFAVVMLYKPGAHTTADLGRLEKGMTPAEVRSIIGEPRYSVRSSIVPGDVDEVWTYTLPTSRWSIRKADYQVKFYKGRLDTWWKIK